MIQRRTPLRRTALKRSQKPIPRVNPRRAKQNRQYTAGRCEYLEAHEFCQVSIFLMGLNEAVIIAAKGWYQTESDWCRIPYAVQIHHRNKARGERKNDQRFWISASMAAHELIEQNKSWAREVELLLPYEADANGLCPNGRQYLETPALMAKNKKHESPK